MNLSTVAYTLAGLSVIAFIASYFLDKNHREDLGVLEVDILQAHVGKRKTRLSFRDVDLPSGEQIQDLDVKIPTTIYESMRKAKKSRVLIHLIRSRGFIRGEYHAYS